MCQWPVSLANGSLSFRNMFPLATAECVPSCRWKVFGKVVEILSSLSSGAGDMMVFLMMTLVQWFVMLYSNRLIENGA